VISKMAARSVSSEMKESGRSGEIRRRRNGGGISVMAAWHGMAAARHQRSEKRESQRVSCIENGISLSA